MEKPEPVSLFVMAYNQEGFIRETIQAALDQDYGNLEILLSDDGSSDRTFAIMQEMAAAYDGPHRIRLFCNQPNLGLIDHINAAFTRAEGVLIVYNAGDDISDPQRVSKLYAAFRVDRPLIVYSDIQKMTVEGRPLKRVMRQHLKVAPMDIADVAVARATVHGCSCAWNPDLHRIFGPITERGTFEDLVLYFRARLAGKVAYVPEPLILHRQGGMSQNRADPAYHRKKDQVLLAACRQRALDLATHARHVASRLEDRIAELEARHYDA